jgi:MYXO-CTERM domain-containing protein
MKSWIERTCTGAVFGAALIVGTAHADPIPHQGKFDAYFGLTQEANGSVGGDALAQANAFKSRLLTSSGYGFEVGRPDFTFRNFTATGSYGPTTFEIADPDEILRSKNTPNNGRFATDGTGWAEMESPTVTFDFSANPLQALGFYMTDLGDFETNVVVTLFDTDSKQRSFNISDLLGPGQIGNSSLVFWGFADTTGASYTRMTISADLSDDRFGIDSFITGSVQAPNPNPVPVPGTLALAAAALGLLALRRRA